MARASGISEAQLTRIYDWYFREDTLRQAITSVIHYHGTLPLRVWHVHVPAVEGQERGQGDEGCPLVAVEEALALCDAVGEDRSLDRNVGVLVRRVMDGASQRALQCRSVP